MTPVDPATLCHVGTPAPGHVVGTACEQMASVELEGERGITLRMWFDSTGGTVNN